MQNLKDLPIVAKKHPQKTIALKYEGKRKYILMPVTYVEGGIS
jgi:hypothetical protein